MITTLIAQNRTGAGRVYAGSTVDLKVLFADAEGRLEDPYTVEIVVRAPDGVETTYLFGVDQGVVRTNVGRYRARIYAAMPGRWSYGWRTSGDGTTITLEGHFNVMASELAAYGPVRADYA
ncbi:MAG: hypothetical protein ACR2PG_06275 [Hyphomicrobiaceae bacterium]